MKGNPQAEIRGLKEGRRSKVEDLGKAESREPKEDAALRGTRSYLDRWRARRMQFCDTAESWRTATKSALRGGSCVESD
jgi:hypothetical protein